MTTSSMNARFRLIRGVMMTLGLGFLVTAASANPIELAPGDYFLSVSFAVIAIFCVALEVLCLRILGSTCHRVELTRPAIFLLVVLNLATLLGVALPVHRLSGSILIAEIAVVLIEALEILKILTTEGVELEFKRALLYSLALNFMTWAIGHAML